MVTGAQNLSEKIIRGNLSICGGNMFFNVLMDKTRLRWNSKLQTVSEIFSFAAFKKTKDGISEYCRITRGQR